MKKLFVSVLAVIVMTSCTTTKTSKVEITPAGSWVYAITGTPEGDFSGDFVVANQDNKYSAKFNVSGNELPFNTCTWDEINNKLTGDFTYSGYNVFFEATLSGEELKGTTSVEGESYPFKATRKM